jgi:hypothetical protein
VLDELGAQAEAKRMGEASQLAGAEHDVLRGVEAGEVGLARSGHSVKIVLQRDLCTGFFALMRRRHDRSD